MNKISWSNKLFYSKKFVILFSIFLSFIIWAIVSITNSSKTKEHRNIKDIPIIVELSQSARKNGLVVDDSSIKHTASVKVEGNNLIIAKLTKDNITVFAKGADSITEPGEYTLPLIAEPKPKYTDAGYTIIHNSIEPNSVTFRVDKYTEAEFKLTNNVIYSVADGHYDNGLTFDTDEIKIRGSQDLVNKIAEIQVNQKLGNISQDYQLQIPLNILDKNGNNLSDSDLSKLTLSHKKVTASISVWKKQILPIKANFEGLEPSEYNCTIDPPNIEIAAPEDILSSLKEIELEPITISKLSSQDSIFEGKIKFPENCKNLSEKTTVKVVVYKTK